MVNPLEPPRRTIKSIAFHVFVEKTYSSTQAPSTHSGYLSWNQSLKQIQQLCQDIKFATCKWVTQLGVLDNHDCNLYIISLSVSFKNIES